MIRYINCFKQNPDLSIAEFRAYWQSAEFDKLIRKVAEFTSAVRYNKNLTLQVSMGQDLAANRGLAQSYDGIVEYYWKSAQHLPNIYASAEGRSLSEQSTQYQSQFIDLANSSAFFTEYQD